MHTLEQTIGSFKLVYWELQLVDLAHLLPWPILKVPPPHVFIMTVTLLEMNSFKPA